MYMFVLIMTVVSFKVLFPLFSLFHIFYVALKYIKYN